MASPCQSLWPPSLVMFHAHLASLKLTEVTVSLFLLRSPQNMPSPPYSLCYRHHRRGRSFSAAPLLQPVASLSSRWAPDRIARLCSNSTLTWCHFRHRTAGWTITGPLWPQLCFAHTLFVRLVPWWGAQGSGMGWSCLCRCWGNAAVSPAMAVVGLCWARVVLGLTLVVTGPRSGPKGWSSGLKRKCFSFLENDKWTDSCLLHRKI
jgi:hypothetical protein